eukprot:7373558-Prymnesium_polylepis.3
MGGDYPEGRECNLCGDRGAAAFIFETLAMPPPDGSVLRVVYVGLQVGLPVLTGARLTQCAVRASQHTHSSTQQQHGTWIVHAHCHARLDGTRPRHWHMRRPPQEKERGAKGQ